MSAQREALRLTCLQVPVLKKVVSYVFTCCLLISFSHSELNGQQLYGSITGRVTDSSGAGIPGAEVTAVNNANNYTQTAVSNETGTYSLQNVPRGTYTLRIGLPGFKEFVKSDVVVTVNNVTREDAQLEVGEISEQVTVTAASTL